MTAEVLLALVFASILGAVFGSFANVLILRWHESATLLGRSHCPSCKRSIRPRHLVPILSWLVLQGRCAYCQKRIHIQYPLVEASCAFLGMIAAFRANPFGPDAFQFWFEFCISIALVVPVVMDLRWKELPLEYVVGLGIFAYAFQLIAWRFGVVAVLPTDEVNTMLIFPLLSALIPVSFFLLQFVASRGRWVGSGDIWFGGMMGLILFSPARTILALYFAYLIGGCIAIVGLLTRRLKRGDRVPFAPALALGTMGAMWFGTQIISWVMQSYA